MEEHRVEGLWDCVYCNTKGIKARYDKCTACGKARGIETYFYLPDNLEAATLSKEEAARTTDEPDWLCDYCGAYNSSNELHCESCGADKNLSKSNYGILHKLTGKLFGKR